MMEKTYYAVEEAAVKGKTLNDGRDAWDILINLPDVLITDYGEVYLPEEFVLTETDPFCRWLNEQNAINPHPKTVEKPETAQCLGCGKTIHAGERAWKRRGFLGFYHSAECLLRDTRYAETVTVTEGLLREEELEQGCTFIDMDA